MTKQMGLTEVSQILGVRPFRVQYAINQKWVPEPRLRIGNHRIYEPVDLLRLAEYFGLPAPKEALNNGIDEDQ